MSEMAVLVIRIRREQAAEYERLFEQSELARWHEYHRRGLFKSRVLAATHCRPGGRDRDKAGQRPAQ